jgi:hypothetical protein
MSSAISATKDSFAHGYKYIASQPYNTQIFNYTTSQNAANVTVGSLTAITGLNSNSCPPGSILIETGKKLYVGAHPGISTFMTYVVDKNSRLGGFIDPQAPCFSAFDGSQPLFLGNPNDNNPVNQQVDLGNSVFTQGNITTNSYANQTTQVLPLFCDVGYPQNSNTVNAFSSFSASLSTSAAVYLNPFAGNNFKINILPAQSTLSTIYVYLRNPSTPTTQMTSTPSGQPITLLVNVSTGLAATTSGATGPAMVIVGNLSTGFRGPSMGNAGPSVLSYTGVQLSTTRVALWAGITDGTQVFQTNSNILM